MGMDFYNILEKSLWCYQDYTVNQKYKINLQNVFPLLWTNYDPQQKTYHFKWQGAQSFREKSINFPKYITAVTVTVVIM